MRILGDIVSALIAIVPRLILGGKENPQELHDRLDRQRERLNRKLAEIDARLSELRSKK